VLHSCSQSHRYLLEEMCHRLDPKWEVGEGRGELYAELCGPVLGLELSGYQAPRVDAQSIISYRLRMGMVSTK
jgi:hypothetical protein